MSHLHITAPLSPTPEQRERLVALQAAFARACNLLAPVVQQHRCWNRVALHHLAYRQLRQAMPELGSQMACNAIYSVCRAARLVYQHPASPFHVQRLGARPLPLLRFTDSCPVYFDRHTLSVRPGGLSMFTLDGRLRFELALPEQLVQAFGRLRLREVVLTGAAEAAYALTFSLGDAEAAADEAQPELHVQPGDEGECSVLCPPYLQVEPASHVLHP